MSIEDPDPSSGGSTDTSHDRPVVVAGATHEVADRAKHDLDIVRQRATEDMQELGRQAGGKVEEAAQQAKSFAADQKDLAAGQINGVAAAITKVADELDGSDQQTVGRYARDLASGLSSIGKTIHDRDVDDLMGLAQDFGRRQPVAFLGAAALAGFMASRFALASAQRRDNRSSATSKVTRDQSNIFRSDGPPAYDGDMWGQNRTGGQ